MTANNWILVTGGTGFVGFALVKRLISIGYKVRIISRGIENNPEFLDFYEINKDKLDVFIGDISNASDISKAFENVDYVFHSAALVNSILPYKKFEEANVLATKNICNLCLRNKVKKLIYISTCDVFGLPIKDIIFDESSPFRKWSEPYADTKIMATQLVKEYQNKGLPTTIFYPGWVYGPGDKAFAPAILEQLKSGVMPVWDNGENHIVLIYIDDLIDAVILGLTKKETDNNDFLILDDFSQTNFANLCSILGNLYNLKYRIIRLPYWFAYLIALVSEGLSRIRLTKNPLMSITDVKSLGLNFRYSTQKAKNLLGWGIQKEIKSGIEDWKLWYENYRSKY